MEVRDYLKDELKRLNRINNLLEEKVKTNTFMNGEPEQIVNNVLAMCKIAEVI